MPELTEEQANKVLEMIFGDQSQGEPDPFVGKPDDKSVFVMDLGYPSEAYPEMDELIKGALAGLEVEMESSGIGLGIRDQQWCGDAENVRMAAESIVELFKSFPESAQLYRQRRLYVNVEERMDPFFEALADAGKYLVDFLSGKEGVTSEVFHHGHLADLTIALQDKFLEMHPKYEDIDYTLFDKLRYFATIEVVRVVLESMIGTEIHAGPMVAALVIKKEKDQ